MSLPGMLYLVVTLGVIALVALRAVPVYLNDREVASVLEATADDPALAGADRITIRQAFGRRLEAGYGAGVKRDDLDVAREGGQRVLHLAYDERRSLFANIALVFSFEHDASMPRRSS